MIHPPELNYCGLLIILDHPSRHDKDKLLSGWAGDQFKNFLNPIAIQECWVISAQEQDFKLPADTRVILFLGQDAMLWQGIVKGGDKLALNDARGNLLPLTIYNLGKQIFGLASYAPQDAYDRKDYEGEGDNEAGENENLKGHGTTKRKNWAWWLMHDLGKVRKILDHLKEHQGLGAQLIEDTYVNNRIEVRYAPALDGLNMALLHHIDHSPATFERLLFLDIETDKNLNITCIGLLWYPVTRLNTPTIYVVPIKNFDGKFYYDLTYIHRFIAVLAYAMSRSTVVIHNAMFDLLVLALRYRIPFPKKVYDTMLAWHRCNPELEKSLGHLTSFFLFRRFHKGDAVYEPRNTVEQQALWAYNADDIFTMGLIYTRLQIYAKEQQAEDAIVNVNKMIRPYLTMMFQGMRIDKEKFKLLYTQHKQKQDAFDKCLNVVTGLEINPRSPKQVATYLYHRLALECPNEDEPTNEKTLLKLLSNYKKKTKRDTIPSVNLILASRESGKMASSMKFNLWDRNYISRANWEVDSFDRLTTAYNLGGTDTYRLASKALLKWKGVFKGWGTNVQNWAKGQRKLIIADQGKILIQVDQAGAEALIVAYLCRNGKFRELFIHDIKPHVFVALHLFKNVWKKHFGENLIETLCLLRPRDLKAHPDFKKVKELIASSDDWPDKERYYFIAKMVCHAANYGMKAPTFMLNVLLKSAGACVLTLEEAQTFLAMYHRLFPEIMEWHAEIIGGLQKSRRLKNLFNEPRLFLGHKDEQLYKKMYAFRPQSTVGQITNRAAVKTQELIEFHPSGRGACAIHGFDLLQNNHDSLLSQCNDNPGAINFCAQILLENMTPNLHVNGVDFQMKAEIQVGHNWGPYKEKDNPGGMRSYTLLT